MYHSLLILMGFTYDTHAHTHIPPHTHTHTHTQYVIQDRNNMKKHLGVNYPFKKLIESVQS